MSVCSIVKLLPRGAVDDLIHYCTRLNEITVLLPNPFHDVKLQRHLNGENVDDAVCCKTGNSLKSVQFCS